MVLCGASLAARGEESLLVARYTSILFQWQAAGDKPRAMSTAQRRQFLHQPYTRALIRAFSKSVSETARRAQGVQPWRPQLTGFYEDHLVELALRPERLELDQMVRFNFQRIPGSEDDEMVHMRLLGKIYNDMFKRAEVMAKQESEDALKFASLAVFAATEAYIRAALFQMRKTANQSSWLQWLRNWQADPAAQRLIGTFWYEANLLRPYTLEHALTQFELILGQNFIQLVAAYQDLLNNGDCGELLRRKPET